MIIAKIIKKKKNICFKLALFDFSFFYVFPKVFNMLTDCKR